MSWLYEKRRYASEQNGTVIAVRFFGRWQVYVRTYMETTHWLLSIWWNYLNGLPKDISAKRLLMLGLAGGGVIPLLHKRFPGCHITVVEWDPTMVRVFKETRPLPPDQQPLILTGDAAEIVPNLSEQFDLIAVDMFTGGEIPEQVRTRAFFESIARRLSDDGTCIVNAFKYPDVLVEMGKVLRLGGMRGIRSNVFGTLYPESSKKGIPVGFTPMRATRSYLACQASRLGDAGCVVGTEGRLGVRWKAGPLTIERYVTDLEPQLEHVHGPRLALWQPITRAGRAADGWSIGLPGPFNRREGLVELERNRPERDWDAHALRHVKKWRQQTEWQISLAGVEPFLEAYAKAVQPSVLKDRFSKTIRETVVCGMPLDLLVARRGSDGPIEAGFAALNLPEHGLSHHLTSFILESAKSSPVGVGLIDIWFERSKASGLRFADFGGFWSPGEPTTWKGLSRFKGQFGVTYIDFPRSLMRLTWG